MQEGSADATQSALRMPLKHGIGRGIGKSSGEGALGAAEEPVFFIALRRKNPAAGREP